CTGQSGISSRGWKMSTGSWEWTCPAAGSTSSCESDDKGPSAALAPSAARSTYREYASRAALGRRLAAGPFSSLSPERFSDRLLGGGYGVRSPIHRSLALP